MGLSVDIVKRLREFTMKIGFTCGTGELLALVGPSGAGKTTLLRVLAGLEHPDQGTIKLDNETWCDTGLGIRRSPQRRGLGFVFQQYPLFPHLTIWENCCFAAPDEEFVEYVMAQWGISHLKGRYPHEVSGGERQRAAVVQAMARRPRVLLMDEPFSALDGLTRRRLREDLKALKSQMKIPIVMVTHDIGEAEYLADQVLFISRGRRVGFAHADYPLKFWGSCANVNFETFRGGKDAQRGHESPHP